MGWEGEEFEGQEWGFLGLSMEKRGNQGLGVNLSGIQVGHKRLNSGIRIGGQEGLSASIGHFPGTQGQGGHADVQNAVHAAAKLLHHVLHPTQAAPLWLG